MEASRYVAAQIHKLIEFLELHTGRPFDWDALRQSMNYIQKEPQLRLDALPLCKATPTPAMFWVWVASIAPIHFLPGNPHLVDSFAGVKADIVPRVIGGGAALPR